MKNLTWQNPEQLFVAQELINKVKSKCCGIKVYYICHAFCAILFGIEIFIDTYMEQKKRPVNRTYFKITIPHPSVLKGYYGGIGFIFYGIMVILYYMI